MQDHRIERPLVPSRERKPLGEPLPREAKSVAEVLVRRTSEGVGGGCPPLTTANVPNTMSKVLAA